MTEPSSEQIEKNVKEFMKQHGLEGFLKLYWTEYLLRLVLAELRSRHEDLRELDRDFGYIYHFENGRISSFKKDKEFREKLRELCEEKAQKMLDGFKKDEKFEYLFEGDASKLIWEDKKLTKEFTSKMHEILDEISKGDEKPS